MSEHNLIPLWFTAEQWQQLRPHIEQLVKGKARGVLLISVEVAPRAQNYPTVGFGVFDADERKALRRALEVCRRKRQKAAEKVTE